MSQQKTGSTRNKSFTVVLIVAIAIASTAFGYWIGTFSPRRVEKIYFGPCEWSEDACVLSIANIGSDELIIDKVWINGTLLDSTDWLSFPSMLFEPGDQGALHINASSMIFLRGATYQFTIRTVAGNCFSHEATCTGGTTGQAGVWLDYDAVSWNQGNITIYLRNKGTSDAQIDAVYVGTSYENLEEQTAVTYAPSTTVEKDGGTITITIDYAWASDTQYYFTIAPKLGQALIFEKKSP